MEGLGKSAAGRDGSVPSAQAGACAATRPADPAAGLLGLLEKALGGEFLAALSSALHVPLELRASSIEECPWSAFLGSLEDPSCCIRIALASPTEAPRPGEPAQGPALEGGVWLEVSPQIVFPIIDRMLGGSGRDWYVPSRPLTEIERRLLGRIGQMASDSLSAAWPAGPGAERLDWQAGPVLGAVPSPAPAGAARLARFTLRMGRHAGAVRLCLPSALAAAAQAALPAGGSSTAAGPGPGGRGGAGPLELSVVVRDVLLSEEELRGLEAGDLLVTDAPADGEVLVRVGGIPKFYARLGASGGKRAIRITRRIDQEG